MRFGRDKQNMIGIMSRAPAASYNLKRVSRDSFV